MRTQSPPAIEATGLVKSFGETRAVDGVDLTVRSGSVYGVLGPNGAGKTTTIRMLATLIRPDAGSARVLGYDVVDDADAVRGVVSLTGQLASVDEDLTGRENLILIGRLLGLKRPATKHRADELLDAFGLSDAAGRLVKNYSGGMRRRLDLAASIVVTPELMFLDEPTTGLDPRSRNQVWASSGRSSPRGPRSCSAPSTSRRPTSWPTGSPSSTTGRSSPRERRPSSRPRSGRGRCTCACWIPNSAPTPSTSSSAN
jgi:ABC-2 type transport system ATP-binding protein